MKSARVFGVLFGSVILLTGCGGSGNPGGSNPITTKAQCTPSTTPEFSYVLTGYSVSMFTVDTCTGAFTATTPGTVSTGYAAPQDNAEQMVADPKGRFAYVANMVSNASDLATISMYTIDPTTGVLTATTPATVPTGFLPQGIAIDPKGRFVYTANSDDATVSMFTINQTTGVLMPTTPASVSTMIPGQIYSSPGFLTVDPTGRFLYVPSANTDGATVLMFSIDQTTGVLTRLSPATVPAVGTPWQVVVAPNGKFAYAVNNLSGGEYVAGVSEYTVDQTTGVLTQNNPFSVPAGNEPTAIAVDPTSRYAYVVNRQDNDVSMYLIDPTTGSLRLNSSATNPSGTIPAGTMPFRIDFDPSGKFVYVTNEDSAASVYTVNSDGTLASAGTTGAAGLSTALASASQ